MTARASIYYDTAYLRDVLLLEDVSASLSHDRCDNDSPPLAYGTHAKVQINLDDDSLIDDLVKALTRLQRDAAKCRLERDVARLTREWEGARNTRAARTHEWRRADELEREIHSKLHHAQKNLDALNAQEGS